MPTYFEAKQSGTRCCRCEGKTTPTAGMPLGGREMAGLEPLHHLGLWTSCRRARPCVSGGGVRHLRGRPGPRFLRGQPSELLHHRNDPVEASLITRAARQVHGHRSWIGHSAEMIHYKSYAAGRIICLVAESRNRILIDVTQRAKRARRAQCCNECPVG